MAFNYNKYKEAVTGSPTKALGIVTGAARLATKFPRVAKVANTLGMGGWIGADMMAKEGSTTRKVLDVVDLFDPATHVLGRAEKTITRGIHARKKIKERKIREIIKQKESDKKTK